MKLSTLSLLLGSLLITSLAVAGCASNTDDASADGDDSDVSAADLSARSAKFVGGYEWRASDSGEFVDFQSLTLKADGTYDAKVDASLVNIAVRCIAFPCTLPESGKWTTVKSGSDIRIKVDPTGPKGSRSYIATQNAQTFALSLTRSGHSTTLFSTLTNTCANVRCTATTHCEMKGINGGAIPVCIANTPTPPPAACVVGGCSAQVCADHSVITTCEWNPKYACYHTATCERQADGACGWTASAALTSCLANN